MTNVHILGATHPALDYLLPLLSDSYFSLYLYSRSPSANVKDIDSFYSFFQPSDIVVSLLPIDISASIISYLVTNLKCSAGSFFLLSSTSVFSKLSNKSLDSDSYNLFANGEAICKHLLDQRHEGLKITILRLSMLWGAKKDKNINFLFNFAQKFKSIPISSDAFGLRAPLHISQLSTVLYNVCLYHKQVPSGFFNLMGPDLLTYSSIVSMVSRFSGNCIVIAIPSRYLRLFRDFVSLFRIAPFYGLSEMFLRQSFDLVYNTDSIFEFVPVLSTDEFVELLEDEYLS